MTSLEPLTSLEACSLFLNTQPPSVIASRLLHDQSICRSGAGIPSLLVYCLPSKSDPIALEISKKDGAPGDHSIPIAVARMRYSSIVAAIKSYFADLQNTPSGASSATAPAALDGDGHIPAHMIPTDDDFHSALKVLRYLQLPQVPVRLRGLDHISSVIQSQLDLGPQLRETLSATHRNNNNNKRSRICYLCRFRYKQRHRLYPSLCHPCGEFNIASSALSLPSNLDLHGKTAVVTGGRVNLGYHTALRLLRCGASVIVSTRYPHDAEDQYRNEPDASHWHSRLRIVGADFRTAKDVFALVKAIISCLSLWGTTRLDILINNAAQTLTDSVNKENGAIRRESRLLALSLSRLDDWMDESDDDGRLSGGPSLVHQDGSTDKYVPRVRGGQFDRLLISNNNEVSNTQRQSSSWVQRMSEIPYEDVISAHSVNTFVPFILIRELFPFMRRPASDTVSTDPPNSTPTSPSSSRPYAYIINVSSREGLPERQIGSSAKDGQHVHTNMSKAALNMLTETEAAKAWKTGRVAMNAVDPGYMSADPVWMEMLGRTGEDARTPLGWEDGVGRVLWVVAKGEKENVPVWGKFLKHFVEIDPRR